MIALRCLTGSVRSETEKCGRIARPLRNLARLRAMRIDSHLHVWANEEESREFPYERPPTVQGNTDYLLELMESTGVDMAMIVQSSTHAFDHTYVSKAMIDHPNRFVGCLLANPDASGNGITEMERLVKKNGFRCARFNPYLWPNEEKMTNDVGKALFQKAGELEIPVGFMLFNGLLEHVEEVETLCTEYSNTKVILDHFGFCKSSSAAWDKLLELATYPQIFIKASAFFRNSDEPFPYLDLREKLRKVVMTYGQERVFWGTDFPWVIEQCGYANAWNLIEEGDKATGETFLSPQETEWLMGSAFEQMFLR